jgi:adenine deaminase
MKETIPLNAQVQGLRRRIAAAQRETASDLVFKGGSVVNVFTGEILIGDVAVCDGRIAGVGPNYCGVLEVDTRGKWLLPGFIDAHIHIESSMLTPYRLAEALVPRGTTAIVSDPHEIANVMGLAGLEFMLKDSADIPLDVFFMVPSCVPASGFETAGAALGASDLVGLRGEPRILGLAEVMNFPGVLAGEDQILEKLAAFSDGVLDGHCPGLTGYGLQAYAAAGMRSDHETTARPEALEKLRSGIMLMIREGSSARNLEELLPLVDSRNSRRCCLVSDDLHAEDIVRKGHLDHILRKAVRLGLDPVTAIRMVTLNPAEHYGLLDRGAIAPGFRADVVILNDLRGFEVSGVYKEGREAATNGTPLGFPQRKDLSWGLETRPLHMGPLSIADFKIPHPGGKARVIGIIPGQLVTRMLWEHVPSNGEQVIPDADSGLLKLFVVERHGASGRIGKGLVRGLELKRGAIASSVVHDSHNVIAAGAADADIFLAVSMVRDMGGGLAVAADGAVLAATPLPIAGLMSKEPLESLVGQLKRLGAAVKGLGCTLDNPFMVLSFLALPVIPEIKLTDRGLVDVGRFSLVPLFEKTEGGVF